jgi:hypothetical protein
MTGFLANLPVSFDEAVELRAVQLTIEEGDAMSPDQTAFMSNMALRVRLIDAAFAKRDAELQRMCSGTPTHAVHRT